MAEKTPGTIHGTTDGGGITGKHDPVVQPPILVGSTTEDQINNITFRLIPIACFRVDDIRFTFDSSFLAFDEDEKKDIRADLQLLVDLLEESPDSPLSVFGHADPVGIDDYNKKLSGRRATIIYALLISNSNPDDAVQLWQGVAKEENWGAQQRQAMQSLTGLPDGTGDADLFKAYMQKFFPPELKLTKASFLAQGADAKGKGDYQGCGEFNPTLIFSTTKNNDFESQTDKTARNDANSQNRRVLVLLFQMGSKIVPAQWPCPRATEGVTGCIKRFFSDGNSRRSRRLPDTDRKFDDKKDTFACRFYQHLVTDSPCETPLKLVKIRLFDPQARPLPFAPCLITETGKKAQAARATGAPPAPLGSTPAAAPGSAPATDKADGFVTLRVKDLPANVNLKWSRPKITETSTAALPDPNDELDFEYELNVTIDIPDDPLAAAPPRLKNLGYDVKPPTPIPGQGDPLTAFQNDDKPRFADIVVDGTLNDPTVKAVSTTHGSTDPVLRAGSDIVVQR